MYFLGIDIGSTSSECVVVNENNKIVGKSLLNSGIGTNGPLTVFNDVLKNLDINENKLDNIVATGYGRNIFKQANEQFSEISCHAKGVTSLFNNVRTIIDIGGQDAKVLKLDDNGILSNFLMNDKCAAGTGRFLDVMSGVLNINIEDIGKIALTSENPSKISSTCTVFAESEVISQLANGVEINDLLAGICESVVQRVASLAKRVGIDNEIIMTGGVAKNEAIRKYMEVAVSSPIVYSPLSQYMGALGAAIYARELFVKK